MHIEDGIIYLAQPVLGQTILTGPATLMTTCLDYTFTEKFSAEELGIALKPGDNVPFQVRVLIPLNNVLGVVIEREQVSQPQLFLKKALLSKEEIRPLSSVS